MLFILKFIHLLKLKIKITKLVETKYRNYYVESPLSCRISCWKYFWVFLCALYEPVSLVLCIIDLFFFYFILFRVNSFILTKHIKRNRALTACEVLHTGCVKKRYHTVLLHSFMFFISERSPYDKLKHLFLCVILCFIHADLLYGYFDSLFFIRTSTRKPCYSS